jgi:integrase
VRLTERSVEALVPVAGRRVLAWDSDLSGFGVRVSPSGERVYVLKLRAGGRQRWLTLGRYGVVKTADARKRARELLGDVSRGADPAASRDAGRRAATVAELAERYLAQHAEPKKKTSSIRTDRYLLRSHVLPRIGSARVDALTREDVAAVHHAMRDTPTSANRTVALLSKILNLAEKWGLRPDGSNPCRHVEKYPERKRRRFLSDEELGRLGKALEDAEREAVEMPSVVAAIRLLVLTGARMGEVLSLRWEHVDRERGVLRLPDSKTGAKEVPLGMASLDVLDRIERTASPWVIEGREIGRPFVNLNKAWRRIRKRVGLEEVRLHDLRRTAASAGASVGLSLEAVGQILGHTQAATTKRYAFLFDDAKRDAADRMSARVAEGLRGKGERKVLALRRKT